ncbi:LysR substrate-binding domain-containing protein [Ensifer sp. ENS06]
MLDIRQLRYFLAVADDLHFTRASDRLHIAQSALSTQIKQLEEQLGVRLLERKKRALVELTDAGRLFAVEARRVIEQVERAETVGRRAGRGELGHIEIGYVASASFSGVMPSIISTFKKRAPEASFRLAEMETPKQIEALREGRIDIAFIRPRHHYPEGITAEVIFQERLLLAVPKDHPLASQDEIRLPNSETFIVPAFDERNGFMEYVADFVAGTTLQPQKTLGVRDFLTALSLVASGSGIALVPASLRCVGMANVAYCGIKSYDRTVGLAIAYRNERPEPSAKAFVQAARETKFTVE